MSMSIVEYFSEKTGSQCGYCRNRNSSFSHGMWGHYLTCQDYQDLIDRGWRRSGRYCYKPTMDKTCCPQYTIKCDATQFQLTKSQKKVLRKFRNFITNGQEVVRTEVASSSTVDLNSDASSEYSEDEQDAMDVEGANQAKAESMESKLKLDLKSQIKLTNESNKPSSHDQTLEPQNQVNANVKRGLGPDPSKPKPKKKKELRKEKALAKLHAKGLTEADYLAKRALKNEVKSIEDLTSPIFPPESRHKFEIRLVKADTSDSTFSENYHESYNVYKKYQMVIHKDSPSKCTLGQFKRFLCNSSLIRDAGFGAFHQQYIIDGKIFAVGVVDVLPHCVSSVYLYYDPDFAFLSPGTLTSLFEIAFTRKLQRDNSALKYYYMGFYIHSCPKMRYKAKYTPSWLLCPKTYSWVPIRQSLVLLDKSKYAVLKQPHDQEGQHEDNLDIDPSGVLFGNRAMTFEVYRSFSEVGEEEVLEVREYTSLVGETIAKRILLYRSS